MCLFVSRLFAQKNIDATIQIREDSYMCFCLSWKQDARVKISKTRLYKCYEKRRIRFVMPMFFLTHPLLDLIAHSGFELCDLFTGFRQYFPPGLASLTIVCGIMNHFLNQV